MQQFSCLIATLLRGLPTSTASSDAVKTQVLSLTGTYGDPFFLYSSPVPEPSPYICNTDYLFIEP
jgi:hypothetical protein